MTFLKPITYFVFNKQGQKNNETKTLEVKISEFKANYLIHKALKKELINKKQGTVSTKTKSEVRGGGRKPWQQKGRGKARAGSTNSPLWKGGGVCFGPKPNHSVKKLNKKEWKLALQTLLYNKRNNFVVLENLDFFKISTKTSNFVKLLKIFLGKEEKRTLFLIKEDEYFIKILSNNLKNVKCVYFNNVTIPDLLKFEKVILSINTLKKIEEIFCD